MKKQKKLGTAGLADFFRQFSVLVSSGLPVAGALEIMETDETDQRFSRACRLFKQRMTDGMAIGDAMEETGAFPEMAVQMIRSAEIGGHLGKTTMKLSEHYEKEHRTEGNEPLPDKRTVKKYKVFPVSSHMCCWPLFMRQDRVCAFPSGSTHPDYAAPV